MAAARQVRVDKGNSGDTSTSQVRNRPIQSTISRDRSKGMTALAEENLQTLARRHEKKGPKTDIPRSQPRPRALFSLDSAADHPFRSRATPPLDFPTQLALEQQQYRSRVKLGEESVHNLSGISELEDHEVIGDGDVLEKMLVASPGWQETQGASLQGRKRKRSKQTKSGSETIKKPRLAMKKLGSGPARMPDNGAVPTPPNPRYYHIIYAVKCYRMKPLETKQHKALFFDDQPVRQSSSSTHLEGLHPHQFRDRTSDDIAFTVHREHHCTDLNRQQQKLYSSGPLVTESIYIQSPILQTALQAVASYTPSDNFTQTWQLTAPHMFISHHRDPLLQYGKQEGGKCRKFLKELLQYVYAKWADPLVTVESLIRDGKINAELLLHLYTPNEMIVATSKGVPTAYVLKSIPKWNQDSTGISLECWAWGYDGFFLERRRHDIFVARPSTSDPFNVTDLSAYPMRFAVKELKDTILARGRKYWNLRYQHHVSYSGWDAKGEEFYSTETRCMLDYRTYKKFHPSGIDQKANSGKPKLFDRWHQTISHDSVLSEEDLMLLPETIHGFILKQKNWTVLLVDNVEPVSWNKDAFERLVVRPSTKEMIKALVMVRIMKRRGERVVDLSRKRDDIIAGKGNGLIMLLHGGPGTGKTLTAESVAEIAEMPLYRVTCGEIGTTADAVEKYLETILHLGKEWNCVLLLDEADVFLEERSMSDLQRNSLVSVFLRILEYYNGILILTTNRVGTFDEAFQSRIQVAIHYPTLDYSSRKRIWENFFSLLYEDEQDADVDELRRHIDHLAEHQMNGRQIRNILTTARQLALYKPETLTWKHVDQAMTTAKDFSLYLQNVHGHSDEQWAREEKLR